MDDLITRLKEVARELELGVKSPGHIAAVEAAAKELNEPHNIPAQLEEIAGRFCDDYCKWPEKYESEGKLWDEHCNKCPVNLLS